MQPPKRRRNHQKESKPSFFQFGEKAEDVARDNDDLDTAGYVMKEYSYIIPVIFHKLNCYESHLIMQYVTCDYAPNSISVIPTNWEKFINFLFGNLRFLDSLKFLTAPSIRWSKVWLRMAEINFSHTSRHYPDSELVFAKGTYLYEYMDGRDKFVLTDLPPIDAFYSSLSEETVVVGGRRSWTLMKIISLIKRKK